MREKRTKKEIVEALGKILEVSKGVKTEQQIADIMGISLHKVRKSLEKDAVVAAEVRENLKHNKKKQCVNIVLDSSMISTKNLLQVLEKQVEKGRYIVLTEPTLSWLEKIVAISDNSNKKSTLRKLEKLFSEQKDRYQIKPMQEKSYDFSENLCQFCLLNPGENILYTANRRQYLLASNMYKIPAVFFKKLYDDSEQNPNKVKLYPMRRKEGKLYYPIIQSDRKYTQYRCKSGEVIDNDSLIEIQRGDNILIATDKDQVITFVHYQIYDINNGLAKRIYSERISKETYRIQTKKEEYLEIIKKVLPKKADN